MAKNLLSTKQVAKMLGFSVSAVEHWRTRGEGPDYIKLGKGKRSRVIYDEVVIEEYLRANTHTNSITPTK